MADHHAPVPAEHVAPPHSHGHDHDAAHVAKAVRLYVIIGISLMVLTCVTVALSYWDLGIRLNFIIGMAVASFKASLVALIFMHLNSERSTIYRLLLFTTIFVIGLFFLSFLHFEDPIIGTFKNHH